MQEDVNELGSIGEILVNKAFSSPPLQVETTHSRDSSSDGLKDEPQSPEERKEKNRRKHEIFKKVGGGSPEPRDPHGYTEKTKAILDAFIHQ